MKLHFFKSKIPDMDRLGATISSNLHSQQRISPINYAAFIDKGNSMWYKVFGVCWEIVKLVTDFFFLVPVHLSSFSLLKLQRNE